MVAVHQAARVLQRLGVVVEAEAAVRRQPGGDRLPPAVHRGLVDVDVHEQVAVGGPLVDLDDLTLGRGAELGQVVVVLGVVLVERAARLERVVDAVAEHVAQLVLVHPAVETEGGDQVDVVDAGRGGEVEHRLDHPLAGVGRAHLRQRQAGVVERDRQLHPGEQQRRQGIGVVRLEQRPPDRAVDVVERGQRLGRVDRPGCGRPAASRG